MKIGYPCINWTIGCKGDRTFRLKSYSEKRLIETVGNNLDCLLAMLQFNVEHNILFFRITSDLVPFASHPICTFDWIAHFRDKFAEIGNYIDTHGIRISMHPGQFTVINTLNESALENSVRELQYHARVLDAMGLARTAKIQLHVGGVYGDKQRSILRFMQRYERLGENIKKRLVIENDDRNYSLIDCLRINSETNIPVLFDVLHHELKNSGESLEDAFALFTKTWKEGDGLPMVDYSYRTSRGGNTRHGESINIEHFKRFLEQTEPLDFDVMLEIKDKEKSALKVLPLLLNDSRFYFRSHA